MKLNLIQQLGAALFGCQEIKAVPSTFTSTGNDGRPVASAWEASRAVREGLKGNPWVYAAATKIATGLGSVPLVLERRQGENWTPDPATAPTSAPQVTQPVHGSPGHAGAPGPGDAAVR